MCSINLFPFSANLDVAKVFLSFITAAQKESLLYVLIDEINLVQDSWIQSTVHALTNETLMLRNVNEPMSAIRKFVKSEEKELFCGDIKLSGKGRTKAVIVEEINHIITKKNEEEFEDLKKKSTKLIYYFRKKLRKLMSQQQQKNSKMLHEMNELMNKNKSLKQRNKSLKQRNKSLKSIVQQSSNEINKTNTTNESLNKKIIELESAIEVSVRQNSSLQNELNQYKKKSLKKRSSQGQSGGSYSPNIFSSSNTYSSINKCRHNF